MARSPASARIVMIAKLPTVPEKLPAYLLKLSRNRAGRASAQIRLGVGSVPDLADHGFQGMTVLPGSFLVEIARCVDQELTGAAPCQLQNIRFNRPIFLATDEVDIGVEVKEGSDGRVAYTFRETGSTTATASVSNAQSAVCMELDRSRSTRLSPEHVEFSVDEFQANSDEVIDAARFYATIRKNGNHYGPGFQKIVALWRMGDQVLGQLSVSGSGAGVSAAWQMPVVFDAITQVLASLAIERNATFVLRSIDSIMLENDTFPDTLWVHAQLREDGPHAVASEHVGDICVFSSSGSPLVQFSGVTFSFLEREDKGTAPARLQFAIASNFTAEPVEESLSFWGHHFGTPVQTVFAPYNQVFQQLLDPHSDLAMNHDGTNVILLQLDAWVQSRLTEKMTLSVEKAEQCFRDLNRYTLPNGLEIAHLKAYETDYLYKEIFEQQTYLKHGIQLRDGATVVDIGANIGLFSLFIMSRCKNAEIYAFEPAPAAYEVLKANCTAYGGRTHPVNAGVAQHAGKATLTFYENSSVFSGFHANEHADRQAIETVVRNSLVNSMPADDKEVEAYIGELTADRMLHKTCESRMTTVSEIIREQGIEGIDLLKIDAEKSEEEILAGIDADDWLRIAQIVVEIHDPSYQAVARIKTLLNQKGFQCAIGHEQDLKESGLVNLYATRGVAGTTHNQSHAHLAAPGLQQNVREFGDALKAFMRRATAPLIVCVCPAMPESERDPALHVALDDAQQSLLAQARLIPNVHAITSRALSEQYHLDNYHEPYGYELGHIPYTPECYAAIGSAVFRADFNLRLKPYKVIVLDCDHTLWSGVCGEDGPLGVKVSMLNRMLQNTMINQMNAGMLLCLSSKNNEQDVWNVFDLHSDMALKREHLVAWRINWHNKADNLVSLASELDLGLDSFIFIDDDPVECANVRLNCPDVLTLQLPGNVGALPSFLDQVWAFDHTQVTTEDRSRTRMYQQNAERQHFRDQIHSLKDFIEGLNLRVVIEDATDKHIDRLSQLTFRTNQFNFSAVRRSEDELRAFLERANTGALAINVADRFGDYGLVGAVLYEKKPDRYAVDTFLLSCRVLGRGVEHTILSKLGQRALADNKRFVDIAYQPSVKNTPVRTFISGISGQIKNKAKNSTEYTGGVQTTTGTWCFEAADIAGLEYNPDNSAAAGPVDTAPAGIRASQGAGKGSGSLAQPLQQVAESLSSIGQLMQAIDKYRLGETTSQPLADGSLNCAFESRLLNIWRRVLGSPRITMNDNFFDAGGTSLKAVQLVVAIKKELDQVLPIVALFESPTVNLLSARLQAGGSAAADSINISDALERGRRRRINRRVQTS